MKIRNQLVQYGSLFILLLFLSACAPALESTPVAVEESASTESPVIPTGYQPVTTEVCQILQEGAESSLGLTFTMETGTPFTDYVNNETGQGCTLTAKTDGASISDLSDARTKLINSFIGWEEQSAYAADGPTGTATAMTRDAGLMLISVSWEPSADANCPTDQPISACVLTPQQKLYTIKIDAAMK